MARKPRIKEVHNARLLKEYASWIYCEGCNRTVAYLCYVTYESFDFHFDCGCGSSGSVHIEFDVPEDVRASDAALVPIKNRLCCPADHSALLTLVEKNLSGYHYKIICKACSAEYHGEKP